ncbi:PilZ domain-containing protein [Aequoribacter fuscus]|jgi:hypothetical protein|uniref:PilZ domain-containing protein n=1 Tax=Aequoribacter fuscus TaxID=2518989 RepID=UPI0005945FB9|nr:PilZ domain-containing protein [Aequoribacter fuscus]QHJ86939.1 PilZ domain-containing protein [Aequoribacter fuscus]
MNRRAHTRIPISSKALLAVEQRYYSCSLIDCSRQGLAVAIDLPLILTLGSEAVLLSNFCGQDFKCTVRLQYKTARRLGFQIVGLDHRDASVLKQLLSQSAVDHALSYDRFGALQFD